MWGWEWQREGGLPAVAELVADVFEVRVAHVVDAEDETMLVLGHTFPDVCEELLLLLARLLGHLCKVERPRAFGLGHGGGGVLDVGGEREGSFEGTAGVSGWCWMGGVVRVGGSVR